MRKLLPLSLLVLLVAGLSLSSCVSKGKFLASENRVHKLQDDSSATHGLLYDCNASVKDLEAQRDALKNANASARNDLANTQNDLQNLSSKSNMTIADQAKRLKNLQDLIQAQKDVMNKLK